MDSKYFYTIGGALVIVIAFLFLRNNNKSGATEPLQTYSSFATISPAQYQDNMDELKIEDLKVGTGVAAISGKKVTVNYLGTLTDGTKFDSSYDRNLTFSFNLGAGEVIQGWDQGIVGMKVGGKRKLTIPSSLGYGTTGAGNVIPPNATLIFEVELLKVD